MCVSAALSSALWQCSGSRQACTATISSTEASQQPCSSVEHCFFEAQINPLHCCSALHVAVCRHCRGANNLARHCKACSVISAILGNLICVVHNAPSVEHCLSKQASQDYTPYSHSHLLTTLWNCTRLSKHLRCLLWLPLPMICGTGPLSKV